MSAPLRISLIDDQEIFIEGLCAIFAGAADEVEVVWTAHSGEEALEKARQDPPDVVLLDYSFKDSALDGGQIIQLLHQENRSLRILLLTVRSDLAVIREVLQAGAMGYTSKEKINKPRLLHAIQSVAAGEYYLDPVGMQLVIGWLVKKLPKSVLTEREIEVAQSYARGVSVRDIAGSLFISVDTVESHIKNIRSKTGAKSRYEVGEYLKELGLEENSL